MCVCGYDSSQKACENKPKEPPPRTSLSEDMIARVEQMVMEDRHLTVRQTAANAGISTGSVDTMLPDDLKLRKDYARWVPRGRRSFRFVFTRHSAFCELSYPRTHIFHVHNAIIACLTQLLMNFDGFHATREEESDNHAVLFKCKRHHFQYLKHYCHSTTSQAFNAQDSVATWPHPT